MGAMLLRQTLKSIAGMARSYSSWGPVGAPLGAMLFGQTPEAHRGHSPLLQP